jgi:hypothetical protein
VSVLTDNDHYIIRSGLEQVINHTETLTCLGLNFHPLEIRPVELLAASIAEQGPVYFYFSTNQRCRCIPVLNAINQGNDAVTMGTSRKYLNLPTLAIENQVPRAVADDVIAGIRIGINL